MDIENFWSEFLAMLATASNPGMSKHTWGQLVSPSLQSALADSPAISAELKEQLGLFGVDFKHYGEKPNTLVFVEADAVAGKITVRGTIHKFRFPVQQVDGIWQLSSGRCEISVL